VVLVVEDDAEIRTMVVRALGTKYRIYEARDGKEAREIIEAIPLPAALVCDIMMPGTTGLQLVRSLRKHAAFSRIPVLFLTAKSAPRDIVAGINAGARHYMTKPFKVADLVAKVDSMVATPKG
jgi:DNA-binding response OmpR family regulator